jgi:SAM-dependent methyltransferase
LNQNKACQICSSNLIKPYEKKFNVFYCDNCEAVFSLNDVVVNYPSIITNSNNPNFLEKITIKIKQKFAQLLSDWYIHYLKEKTDLNFKNSLDIGAGFGNFVNKLNELGVNAYGIESDEKIKQISKTDKIIIGDFEIVNDLPTYDLISVNQTIYYFENPEKILKKIKSLLNKKGIIFLVTVNTSSTITQNLKTWGDGMKICLGKKNIEMIAKTLDLDIIDCEAYKDNFYVDFALYKQGKINSFLFWIKTLAYYLKIKNIYVKDENGNNLFVLLKLNNNSP